MSWENYLALGAALFIFALTPGPGVFALVARALAQGFVPALFQALGLVIGDLVWLAATLLGLGYIAAEFANLFQVIKIAGGLYLIYLGIMMWKIRPMALSPDKAPVAAKSALSALSSGLLTTLGNPKVMVFYGAIFPAFVKMESLTRQETAWVACLSFLVPLLVLVGYAIAAARARQLFRNPKNMQRLNRSAGSVMIASGAVVANS